MADVERFEAFVRAYQDMVFATAVRLLGNPAEAEDVAQTVFLKAFEQFDTLDANPAAGGWLRTVARNACLNHLARYRSLQPNDVQAAARQFLGPGRVLVSVVPEGKKELAVPEVSR